MATFSVIRISHHLILAVSIFIGHLAPSHGQNDEDGIIDQDPCVDQEFNRFFVGMNSRFQDLAVGFTGKIPAPQLLYDNLFNQTFTSDQFREYSDEYRKQRAGFHGCKNSEYKRMSLYGFDFADYVFIQKADDFAIHLPCIQKSLSSTASNRGTTACSSSSNCRSYSTAASQANAAGDSHLATAKTCQFQNCTSQCGMSQVQAMCGFDAASLYRGALFKVYDVMRAHLEPDDARANSALPKQCRRLAEMLADGSSATSSSSWSLRSSVCDLGFRITIGLLVLTRLC